jgi:hypothetical protein
MNPDDPRQVVRQIDICRLHNWPQSLIPTNKLSELITKYGTQGSGSWVVIGPNNESFNSNEKRK